VINTVPNKVVLIREVCVSRFLYEIVTSVHGNERDKVYVKSNYSEMGGACSEYGEEQRRIQGFMWGCGLDRAGS